MKAWQEPGVSSLADVVFSGKRLKSRIVLHLLFPQGQGNRVLESKVFSTFRNTHSIRNQIMKTNSRILKWLALLALAIFDAQLSNINAAVTFTNIPSTVSNTYKGSSHSKSAA